MFKLFKYKYRFLRSLYSIPEFERQIMLLIIIKSESNKLYFNTQSRAAGGRLPDQLSVDFRQTRYHSMGCSCLVKKWGC